MFRRILQQDLVPSWRLCRLSKRSTYFPGKVLQGSSRTDIRRAMSAGSAKRGPIGWGSLGLFLVAGGGVVIYVRYLKSEKENAKATEMKKSVGMASLGGPFELVNQSNEIVTDKDFLGKWVLLYFGFCHCPDVCPDQLEKMAKIVNELDNTEGLPKIQPLFITVDPQRDDVAAVASYVKEFHPKLIGLTGSQEQIKSVCKNYRVYYSAGPKDVDDDYIVDHTIIMYLLNPDGKFTEYFGQNRTVNEVVATVANRMLMFKSQR